MRIMRLLVMFDLPTGSKRERKSYALFRKFLINDGYHMDQYSVYSRVLLSRDSAETHLQRLRANLPEAGDQITAGEAFADVESVKAVSDVFSPVTGTVALINEDLLDAPEAINEDPYGAWLVRIEEVSEVGDLLDADAYEAHCAQEA